MRRAGVPRRLEVGSPTRAGTSSPRWASSSAASTSRSECSYPGGRCCGRIGRAYRAAPVRCSREDSVLGDATGARGAAGSGGSAGPAKNNARTPQVRVRFQLQYRCHSRQMLAVAGSMAPLGWSFLSIARNPLNWTEGDWWTIELNFPEGARIEYKYVVLEDQNWTKQDDEAAEGLVPLYRPSGDVTEPVTEAIVRKMAIVAWQPGPNLVYTVPSQRDAAGAEGTGETFLDEDKVTEIPITEKLDFYNP
ncbi:CBM20 domain-containing protein [Chloropicon roscoffensis]|uniref:CBM20 domain-containing protein n=1 Tax=Chloropicon roscoffensis TaxID=1461544 RepID=A0A7S3C8Q2_9CHLO|mmetsp:Transcript_1763/g.5539  ORF Transcript_1763/g.5539 Transcript_1763/m.5539 type:complete len:249 (+) Transcript_1763:190-936(+)